MPAQKQKVNKSNKPNLDNKRFAVVAIIKLAPIFIALYILFVASLSNETKLTYQHTNVTCNSIFVSIH